MLLGDREFGSVKLASWLCEKNIRFVLRIKKGRYIQEQGKEFKRLSECGLVPGTSFYLQGVKVTKQKGFGKFDVASYWQRKYRDSGEDEGWYLLTNIGTLKQAVTAFKYRSGIEAMFKDCKTGGYNLEKSYACDDRLKSLILLIALAYSCAILQGRKFKLKGFQKYIGRLIESRRSQRRHSSFWIGLYGQLWVVGMEFYHATIAELMKIRPCGADIFSEGFEGYVLYFINLTGLSPRQVDNVYSIANTALISGQIARMGAGVMPVRGHSNVQGFGSMGVTVKLKEEIKQALEKLLGRSLNLPKGYHTRDLIEAAEAWKVDSLLCVGGNLYGANPDSAQAKRALGNIDTTTPSLSL